MHALISTLTCPRGRELPPGCAEPGGRHPWVVLGVCTPRKPRRGCLPLASEQVRRFGGLPLISGYRLFNELREVYL